MKVRLVAITLAVSCLLTSTTAVRATNSNSRAFHPERLQPTKVVTIKPFFGYSPERIRARLSHSEIDVIKKLQNIAETWVPATPPPANFVNWIIEPSAEGSPTIAVAAEAFQEARALLSVPFNTGSLPVFIVVGRTQKFIKEEVAKFRCIPSIATSGGDFLMGATICNRSVIVINLSGYLFLRRVDQPFTPSMETRREPNFSAMSYLIVDRNISSIPHEWTHVARSRLSDGFVPDNEPAWFREGLAEVIAALARVRAADGKYPFVHFHIIRLRKFANWIDICGIGLARFRTNIKSLNGCKYLTGAAAMELLIAKYGGIPKIITLYAHMRESGDFLESFRYTYGMTLSEFEKRADVYSRYIAQAIAIGP